MRIMPANANPILCSSGTLEAIANIPQATPIIKRAILSFITKGFD